jgi:hypothetical protein
MTKQIVSEINCNTQEIIVNEKDETSAETQARLKREAEIAAAQAEAETKATAKAALLVQLGITEEQARLLLS